MITTTYKFGQHVVRIHDPADTPEKKEKQRQRIEKACIRFCEELSRTGRGLANGGCAS